MKGWEEEARQPALRRNEVEGRGGGKRKETDGGKGHSHLYQ